ncbi:MAG: radical SAM protein [Patescibacteria group bacterium]
MEKNNLCVINLPGQNNFAVVSPGRIAYGLNASENELQQLVADEEKHTENIELKKENCNTMRLSAPVIALMPTFDCNLRCVYCYARGGEIKKTMSFEVAKSAIEAVAQYNNCRERLDIYLVGGGEPLLPFGLVYNSVEFAKSIYKMVIVHVVTNGTFSDDVLQWIIKNKVDIRISYDGPMHRIQRPFAHSTNHSVINSEEIIKRNITILTANGISVTVQCIVAKGGLQTMCQTIDEVVGMGVKVLKFEPMLATSISRGVKEMEPNPIKYAEALLDAINYAAQLGNIKIDTGYFTEPSDQYYCGIAQNNKIITPDGLITACVEVSKETDPYANSVIFGKIEYKSMVVNKKRVKTLQSFHYKNQESCVRCNLRFICQGGCPMANIWRSGIPIRKSSFTCAVEHKLIPALLLKIVENPKIAEVVFNNNAKFKTC